MKSKIMYEVKFCKRIGHLESRPVKCPELDVSFDTSESDFATELMDYIATNIGYEGKTTGLSIQTFNHDNDTSIITFKQMEDSSRVVDPNGRFTTEYIMTINRHLVRGATTSELSNLFRDATVINESDLDNAADNLMWFRRGVDDTIDQLTTKFPDLTEPSEFPEMAKLNLALNGESLDLPLTSDIADALQSLLRVAKTQL